MKEVAERLRYLRESVKLSQVKMAEVVGVKQSSLNRYELNQASPTFETLTRYADYFDVSINANSFSLKVCRYVAFSTLLAARPSPAANASGSPSPGPS